MPVPRVYWIHGCGNCVRVKGFLRDRGIDFDAVDVQSPECTPEDLARLRPVGVPVVQLGDDYISGIDLAAVAALLGLGGAVDGLLPVSELSARAARLLRAAARSVAQIPRERLDDPIPGQSDDLQPAIHRADGSPYHPHRTNRELAGHLLGHAAKFVAFARHSNPAFAVSQGEFSAYGEPAGSCSPEALVDGLHRLADRIETCPAVLSADPVDTFFGPRTRHDLLQTMTCAIGQHTRQLADVVERLGLVSPGPFDPGDLAGLTLPTDLWT